MNLLKDEEVKKSILEAALNVFQKWGYNKTTMQDIAKEARKGKSTLYYYYKSKEEILEAVAIQEMHRIISIAENSIRGISLTRDKIRTFIFTLIHEINKTASLYSLIAGEISADKKYTEMLLQKVIGLEEIHIYKMLKDGFVTGEISYLKEDELELAARAISKFNSALINTFMIDEEREKNIDIILRMISKGI